MASTAFFPKGSQLLRKNPTTSVYEAIPQCTSIGFPGSTQEYDDITNHDSVGGYAERLATIKTPRDVPVEILFVPDNAMHSVLFDDAEASPVPLRTWRIMFPAPYATRGFQFDAYPASPDGQLLPRNASRVTFTLGVSGAVTRLS